ncbi:hypothetical protein CERSUDRAFT_123780 [Gelatoporia subvermispora B]|uniref:Uncharacterized protein n=1 Tax=Ceriporiopsis subvermispora (strain B) TaxID=914234 RepID=M2RD03_CERS8|nr:hypothetical protein CERSUDRAFT_123780 [Gelatoporia subvermispora B]
MFEKRVRTMGRSSSGSVALPMGAPWADYIYAWSIVRYDPLNCDRIHLQSTHPVSGVYSSPSSTSTSLRVTGHPSDTRVAISSLLLKTYGRCWPEVMRYISQIPLDSGLKWTRYSCEGFAEEMRKLCLLARSQTCCTYTYHAVSKLQLKRIDLREIIGAQ